MKELKITLRPESVIPTDTGFEMRISLFEYAMATVGKQIPTGAHSELWPGRNPRDTEIKFVNNGDTEKMLAAIADYSLPSKFQASHGGLHYSCSYSETNPDGTVTLTLKAENSDSIFGGGHSHYRFEYALEKGVLTAECPHFIRVSFHIGLSNQEITNIIHAQEQFKVQTEESIDSLNGLYDWVKEELASNGYKNVMRFNQNQKNDTGGNFTASVTDYVVQGMHFFTKPFEEHNDHISYPTSSYSSPSSVAATYRREHKNIAKNWRPLLMHALDIREHIEASIIPLFEQVLAESCEKNDAVLTKEEKAAFWKVIGKQKSRTTSTINPDVKFYKVNKSIWQTALFLMRRFVVLTKDGYTLNKTPEEIKAYWDEYAGPEYARTIFGSTWSKLPSRASKENPNQWRYERSRDMNSLLKSNDFWGKLAQREQLAHSMWRNAQLEQEVVYMQQNASRRFEI